MENSSKPIQIINSVAPMRICDNGGWTDTWFARHGQVLNLAVYPHAEVQIRVYPQRENMAPIIIHAENYGDRYGLAKPQGTYGKHPLLEAALDYMRIPKGLAIEATIYSDAPAGCSTGTSAAVSVALIGALDRLTPGQLTPYEAAMTAHRIETELLKLQSGVQDQLAAAYGGINFIEIAQFPHASVSPIHLPDSTWWELERRLVLIFVGEPHSSSETHKLVIRRLEGAGPDAPELDALRRTAASSRDALYAGDFQMFGRAMVENTEAQRNLHPALVGPLHQAVIDIARAHHATGWKVNGAGGDGGSVSILTPPDSAVKRAMVREIEATCPTFRNIPIYLSRFGLRRWNSQVGERIDPTSSSWG